MSYVVSLILRKQNRNFRDCASFNVGCKHRICPSAGCASATNAIGSGTDIYSGNWVLTNDLVDFDTVIG